MVSVSELATAARTRVLFLNTPMRPPLGADTWVHTAIMQPPRPLPLPSCTSPAPSAAPTTRRRPTEPCGRSRTCEVVPSNFGPELSGRSASGQGAAALATRAGALASHPPRPVRPPATASTIIHTSDRPRDAFASVAPRPATGAPPSSTSTSATTSWMGRLLRWSLRQADALVAVSEFVGRSLVAGGSRPGAGPRRPQRHRRRRVDARASGATRCARELGIPASAPVVVTVCRLFPEKGAGDLIRAIAEVRARAPGRPAADRRRAARLAAGLRRRSSADGWTELGVADPSSSSAGGPTSRGLLAAADVFAMPST